MKLTFKKIIGKHLLVGLTFLDNNENILERVQFHGIIQRAGKPEGIVIIRADNNEEYILPPDLSAIFIANQGEYKLHSTGETVVNPDLLAMCTIQSPKLSK